MLTLIYTGMRIGELFSLPLEDYHETYVVGGEKTEAGRDRMIPIRPEGRDFRKSVDEYIQFYNEIRPRKTLAYKTPVYFEKLEPVFITGGCRMGEGFPCRTRKFFAGILTDFKGN